MNDFVSKQNHRTCPICGSDRFDIIYHYAERMDFFKKFPQEFDIVSCKTCGFVYSDIFSSQAIFDEYYAHCSVYDNMGVTYGKTDDDKYLAVYAQRASEIEQIVSKTDSILEIGSANGFLLEELRKIGFEDLSALDLSETSLKDLERRGFKAYRGGIFASNNPMLTEQFDCICLTQVMEHIYDLHGAMQSMKRMLKPGGRLYIEVPDAGSFNDFDQLPFGFFNFEHIGYFDETSLKNLAIENGLEIERIFHKKTKFHTNHDTYPCVAGVFKKRISLKSQCNSVLREYVSSSELKIAEYIDMYSADEEIALWGMGSFARQLLGRVVGKWNIKYLVDSNPIHEGKDLQGYSICTPTKLKDEHFNGTVLITTALYSSEVIDQIKDLGLECSYRKLID